MRIAFLADPLDKQYGGIHIYTREILKALSKVDKKNEYLVVRPRRKGEFEGFEEVAVPYAAFPGYRAWRQFIELPRLMVKKGVDLVVEPAHFGPFNLPANIKRITVIHDLTMFLLPQYHPFWNQFLQRKLLPRILRKTDRIITNSVNTTQDLFRFFPFTKDKTTTIHLGKGEAFKPRDDPNILSKYKIKQPYLLCLGTLEPRKNLTTLIHAFNDFKSKTGLPHRLVLAGKKGWKSERIFSAIEHSPFRKEILLPGYVERKDLPVLYSMAELFVYPSLYEGFGLPALEAMACGCPVIISNASSLPEVGGTAAHYFSPGSMEELSQKMEELCSNETLRVKSSVLGLEQAAHFTWEKTAEEMIEVFEKFY